MGCHPPPHTGGSRGGLPGGRGRSIHWQCFTCQRAAASAGGSWSEHLEASWYTDGSGVPLRRWPPRAGGAVPPGPDRAPPAFRRGSFASDLAYRPFEANGTPREAYDASRIVDHPLSGRSVRLSRPMSHAKVCAVRLLRRIVRPGSAASAFRR